MKQGNSFNDTQVASTNLQSETVGTTTITDLRDLSFLDSVFQFCDGVGRYMLQAPLSLPLTMNPPLVISRNGQNLISGTSSSNACAQAKLRPLGDLCVCSYSPYSACLSGLLRHSLCIPSAELRNLNPPPEPPSALPPPNWTCLAVRDGIDTLDGDVGGPSVHALRNFVQPLAALAVEVIVAGHRLVVLVRLVALSRLAPIPVILHTAPAVFQRPQEKKESDSSNNNFNNNDNNNNKMGLNTLLKAKQ